MNRLLLVILPLLGLVAGFWLARAWDGRAPAAPAIVEQDVEQAAEPPAAPPAPATAVVSVISGAAPGARTAHGIVVGQADFIVVEAAAIAGAEDVTIETAAGERTAARAVWGGDERYGLVALRPEQPLQQTAVLQPAAGAGSLYRGATVTVISARGTARAEIVSPAQRNDEGGYFYELSALDGAPLHALADADGRLVGLATLGDEGGNAHAIDAEPIVGLYALRNSDTAMTLAEFSERFFATSGQGRLLQLGELLAAQRYTEALAHAERIINLDERAQREVPPLARRALAGRVDALVADDRPAAALAALDEARDWLEPDTTLAAQRARLLETLGRDTEALEALLAIGATERARMLVLSKVLTAEQDNATIALLERAAAVDPDFAAFQRLLGEHYARTGDTDAAVTRLARAIALDPALRPELGPLMERLRARRHTPALAEIPITRTGGTLLVDTRINGSPQAFRFMVDTGASYTAISTETALRLGLRDIFLGAPVVELETANGRIYTTTAMLDSVQIGTARVDRVEAVILEQMGRVDGLLGQSFLRHFDIEIDRTRGVLALHRRAGD